MDWKRGALSRITFIAMESALHRDDRYAGELAAQESTPMSDCGGFQEMRDVCVIDRFFELDCLADRAEARAEDNSTARLGAPATADVRCGFIDLCGEMLHTAEWE